MARDINNLTFDEPQGDIIMQQRRRQVKIDQTNIMKAVRNALHTLRDVRDETGVTFGELMDKEISSEIGSIIKRPAVVISKVVVDSEVQGILEITVTVKDESVIIV